MEFRKKCRTEGVETAAVLQRLIRRGKINAEDLAERRLVTAELKFQNVLPDPGRAGGGPTAKGVVQLENIVAAEEAESRPELFQSVSGMKL